MKTANEIKNLLQAALEKYESDYTYVGIRFEDKERTIGEIIEDESRHNDDRDDEREFPEFGTEEYDEMETLGGVSAWDLAYIDGLYISSQSQTLTKHAYVISSDSAMYDDSVVLDDNEIVLVDAEVMEIIF